MLTTHPLLVPRLRRSRSYTSCHPNAPLWSVTGPLYLFLHELNACDKQQRLEFPAWGEHEEVTVVFRLGTFSLGWHSEQVEYALFGIRKSTCAHREVHYAPKITVWVAISSHRLTGPLFCDQTVNSECCLNTLHISFVPQFIGSGLPLNRGYTTYSKRCLGLLHDTLGPPVISH
jgi:hypothetical protein